MEDNYLFLESIPVIWDPAVLGTENGIDFRQQVVTTKTDVRASSSSLPSSNSRLVDATGEYTRRGSNFYEATAPVHSEKKVSKEEVEPPKITEEESSSSSGSVICGTLVPQTELVTSLRLLSTSSKNAEVVGSNIPQVLNHSTDVIILETAPEEGKLPELTDDILDCTPDRDPNDIITRTLNNIEITLSDIKSLEPGQWLNDNVINAYLDLIAARSKFGSNNWPSVYVFTTFFYPKYVNEGYSENLKRWTGYVDLFSFDLLIFPIHLEAHWSLAVADTRKKAITYFDSLGGKNIPCTQVLLQYLKEEHEERKKSPLNHTDWKLEIAKNIPQQENGSDCGLFVCKFAEYLSRDARLNFKQRDMKYYRQRMIYDILAQDLMPP